MKILPINTDHVKFLKDLFYRNRLPETTLTFDPFPLDTSTATEICEHTGSDIYVAGWHHNSIISLGMLRGWDEGYDVPSLGILVDKDFRFTGYGKILAFYLLSEARDRGSKIVRISVHKNNTAAHKFFYRMGFSNHCITQRSDGKEMQIMTITLTT